MATPQSLPSTSAPHTPPPAATTRTRLLDAAYELLVQDGYHATTVQSVARRAGLTTGAIYANFANKQELMALAVLDRWTHLQQQLLAGAGDPEDSSGIWPDHFLVNLIVRLLTAPAAPEHRLLTEVTGAVLRDSGSVSPLLAGVQMLETMVRSSIEQAQEDGGIDDRLATDAIVAVIVNVYLGTITSKAWGLHQPEVGEVEDVLSAINRGLALGPE